MKPQTVRTSLKKRQLPLASARRQQSLLQTLPLHTEFDETLARADLVLSPGAIDVLQVNVGKLCNQTCRHCHVDAGPDRTEVMGRSTMQACLRFMEANQVPTVDITGGAPELNPNFKWFVRQCTKIGVHVMNRCNLTVLLTGTGEGLPEFFAEHGVEVVCSLPHYQKACTDTQRGEGVYDKSIEALKRLNRVGYGDGVSGLRLVLVTNPVGASLSGCQDALYEQWSTQLKAAHGIVFDKLYTITNMPISRYLQWLSDTEQLQTYMQTLIDAFNPAAVRGLMCRNTLSVGWDGALYDCDFNQMLELNVDTAAPHIATANISDLMGRDIVTGRHCFGCTAGAGSSCGGATA